jgi:hypothetical protein
MAFNKGNFAHLGGYAHAALHGLTTGIILFAFGLEMFWFWALAEFVAHYLIDYSKVNLCKAYDLHHKTHGFWWALGFDQYLHALCYLIIANAYFGN